MTAFRREVLALVFLTLLSLSWLGTARYLPTRGDGSRREQIKELLRAIMDMAPEDRDTGRSSFPYDFQGGSVAKRSLHESEGTVNFQREEK
ncbi:hypothetical protein JTE90_009330 [Oedothorax gibbosus]|uniref:Uncharacterized protein n=1 Tax=Oedothorax gibbosus TaxID=931172 RepID=A0AAV6VRI6_9ARAC|nr:hypothetical protein JTE90_009330 [Oedothorax gibbosus]